MIQECQNQGLKNTRHRSEAINIERSPICGGPARTTASGTRPAHSDLHSFSDSQKLTGASSAVQREKRSKILQNPRTATCDKGTVRPAKECKSVNRRERTTPKRKERTFQKKCRKFKRNPQFYITIPTSCIFSGGGFII